MKKLLFCLALATVILSAPPVWADAVINPGETFELRISGVPGEDQSTISSTYTVDGEGNLNMPYIGKIMVAHLTASAIQSVIERAYVSQGIFTHPTITLNIAPTARFVNVSGAVKGPGRIPYTADMTVLTAIIAAGDFNEFANPGKVQLTRDGKVIRVDCKRAKKDPSQDQKVLPRDQIFVPESFF